MGKGKSKSKMKIEKWKMGNCSGEWKKENEKCEMENGE